MSEAEKNNGRTISSSEDKGRYFEATRSDGLKVFFDRGADKISECLNYTRRHGDRKAVFLAVGILRGLQIAKNYAEKYGTAEETATVVGQIEAFCSAKVLEIGAEKK